MTTDGSTHNNELLMFSAREAKAMLDGGVAVITDNEFNGVTVARLAMSVVHYAEALNRVSNNGKRAAAMATATEDRATAAEARVAELLSDRADAAGVLVTEVERAQTAERRVTELTAALRSTAHLCDMGCDRFATHSDREWQPPRYACDNCAKPGHRRDWRELSAEFHLRGRDPCADLPPQHHLDLLRCAGCRDDHGV